MTNDELCLSVMRAVKYQIKDTVTKYLRKHPEYFVNQSSGSGKISSFNITLSYQPDSPSAIETCEPCIFIQLGYADNRVECHCYDHNPDVYKLREVKDGVTKEWNSV